MINLLLSVGTLLLFALMWFTPDRLKALGVRRRSIAAAITLLGLCSLFIPLIVTSPPVFGHGRWSPLGILLQAHAGTLGVSDTGGPIWTNPSALYLAAPYVLLSATLLALAMYPSPKLVAGLAASVPIFSVVAQWGSPYEELSTSLKSLFYGEGTGLVDIASYATVQMIVSIGVLVTIYLGTLDD
jgi:hypothetical protein